MNYQTNNFYLIQLNISLQQKIKIILSQEQLLQTQLQFIQQSQQQYRMAEQQNGSQTNKKIKLNEEAEQKQWIVVKKKTTPLTITVADHSKVNRYYSHKSIQKYLRYLLANTQVNPMWLAIKRQSQITHIFYFDIEIQDYLFEKLLQQKTLPFLSSQINIENKAIFKEQRMNRFIWDSLLIYDEEQKLKNQEIFHEVAHVHGQKKMSPAIYDKYISNILTPQELKQNLYPDMRLPLYQSYHTVVDNKEGQSQVSQKKPKQTNQEELFNDKNLILVIDCQMVTTITGFELARCTIVNYEEEVLFDEFFKPQNPVISYNTEYSGITKEILQPITNTIKNTLHPFLSSLINPNTILIGHSLQNDFNAMKFYHSKVIDTSVLFVRKNGSKMKLKNLADKILNRKIQSFTHDSKEDCLATLHLVQIKLQNEKLINIQKQYHLLRDLVKAKHGVLVVDYQLDNMRQYNSVHFQKVSRCQSPEKIVEIIKKYSNKLQVAVPKIAFTRFQKPQSKEWESYYEEVDRSLEKIYNAVPQGTVLFINFQVNQLVRIVPFTSEQSKKQRSRPFFVPLPKN